MGSLLSLQAQTILDAKRLSALGMIVNELVTNAMKYAFCEHPEPTLQVQGRVEGDQYTLVVLDNSPGLPESFDPATSSSFGISMISALTDNCVLIFHGLRAMVVIGTAEQ